MGETQVDDERGLLYCPVCGATSSDFGPGPGGRPNVVCPRCGSLDRHRVMALVAPAMIERAPEGSAILDIAPAGGLSLLIRASSGHTYLSIDLDPDIDGRTADVRADIGQLPIRTQSVGFLLCSHVLEHVNDDRSAIQELFRVLMGEGAILIQVPRRRGAPTDEDLALTAEQRLGRYGQSDHVRLYGDDFEERIRHAGLAIATTSYSRLLPPPLLAAIGVASDHELWIATRHSAPEDLIDPSEVMKRWTSSVLAHLAAAINTAETSEANYERLRNFGPIRMASNVKNLLIGHSVPRDG
jgi:SAM-dependent methyltransferase